MMPTSQGARVPMCQDAEQQIRLFSLKSQDKGRAGGDSNEKVEYPSTNWKHKTLNKTDVRFSLHLQSSKNFSKYGLRVADVFFP